jgi:hypothetical protein
VGVDTGSNRLHVRQAGFQKVVAYEFFERLDRLECHRVRQGFVHLPAIETEVGARTHFFEIGGLALKYIATEIAFHMNSELFFGHERESVRVEITAEKSLAFEAHGHGKPECARACGRSFEFDARAPGLATRGFLPTF